MSKIVDRKFEELVYKFTREELHVLGEDLARANQHIYDLRSGKAATMASINGAIKEAEKHAADLTQKITTKSELRDIEVVAVLDRPTVGMKTIVRVDNGEEVRSVPMTDAERQERLNFEGEKPDGKKRAARDVV